MSEIVEVIKKRGWPRNVLLILVVLYIISPFDFLSEGIIGPLAYADDFFIAILKILEEVLYNIKRKKEAEKLVEVKKIEEVTQPVEIS